MPILVKVLILNIFKDVRDLLTLLDERDDCVTELKEMLNKIKG